MPIERAEHLFGSIFARPCAGQDRMKDRDHVPAVDRALEDFDAIVEKHRRSIYHLCYRFVNNHEDAADVAQEVFLRAYRAFGNFKGGSSVSTWLYRIGVNACLNRLAARPPASVPLENAARTLVDGREDPASALLKQERAERVRAAISKLPPKQRSALILRVYHDLSHHEIADILDSTEGAVKANFFHALQNLKRLLEEDSVR